MSNGVGTSKEDKTRKRRSLPYEKKPQADKARLNKSIKKYLNQIKLLKDKFIDESMATLKNAKKKGKPHLKHGGKAKKKYGVVGKPTLRKGGKAK